MDVEFQGQYEQGHSLRAVKMYGTPDQRGTIWRVIVFLSFTALAAVFTFAALQDGDAAQFF